MSVCFVTLTTRKERKRAMKIAIINPITVETIRKTKRLGLMGLEGVYAWSTIS